MLNTRCVIFSAFRFILLVLVLWGVSSSVSLAQPIIKAKKTFTNVRQDSVYFLDYWVLETSIRVSVKNGSVPGFVYSPMSGTLRFTQLSAVNEGEISVEYEKQALPFPRFLQNRTIVTDTISTRDSAITIVRRSALPADVFGDNNLQRSGSLTRGITLGTDGNVSVESGLRFELSGNVTEDIYINATLTDQNTPIQPDGSTQNIREFDLVYILMKARYGQVQLGDIDVVQNNSFFSRFNRRLQGISLDVGDPDSSRTTANVSIASPRGVFQTQRFQGQDGVQGPYRLRGLNGERFIIVVAGTERVYIDNVLMTRGEENDYIIDYGLGEIYFTSNRIITDLSRITVDFQYIDAEYQRTFISTDVQSKIGERTSVGVTYLRSAENDDILLSGLSESELEVLQQAGDGAAIVSGVRSFNPEIDGSSVSYERRDTVVDGTSITYYNPNPSLQAEGFRVRFSNVGDGNGSYVRAGQTINGVVYEWQGPGLGEYDTLRSVRPPGVSNVLTVNSETKLGKHLSISAEWALSVEDENRFSDLDDANNDDHAVKGSLSLSEKPLGAGAFSASVDAQSIGSKFVFFDRVYEAEFFRKWLLSGVNPQGAQIYESNVEWKSELLRISSNAGYLNADSGNTKRGSLSLEVGDPQKAYSRTFAEWVGVRNELSQTDISWFRERGESYWPIPVGSWTVKPQFGFEAEQRRDQLIGQKDSLLPASWMFADWRPGVFLGFKEFLKLGTDWSYRTDLRQVDGNFTREAVGTTQGFYLDWKPSRSFRTSNSFRFRRRDFSELYETRFNAIDSDGIFLKSTSTYSGLNRGLDARLLYEANTERRARLQETYIEIGPELGQYIWDDVNGDGIQQVDEFFPEQTPNEGTFVRQFLPSDELFPIVSLNVRARFRLEPFRFVARDETGWKRALRWIAAETQVNLRENNRTSNLSDIYLLRLNRFQQSGLTLQGRQYYRQVLKILPAHQRVNFELATDATRGFLEQVAGNETQRSRNYEWTGTYRSVGVWTFRLKGRYGTNRIRSENLENRNFDIRSFDVEPELQIRWMKIVTSTLNTRVAFRRDDLASGSEGQSLRIRLRNDVFSGTRLQVSSLAEYRFNDFDRSSNAAGIFELTDGAGLGRSWVWSLQGSYRISQFLRANLNYDGRTIPQRPAIHTLRFVVSALF